MYNPLLVWVNVCPLCVVVFPPPEELELSSLLLESLELLLESLLELELELGVLGFGGGVEF